MRNNNDEIVRKLSRNNLAVNRGRNAFLVLAVALTTLMLTNVFSLGMSFLESVKIQQLRIVGTAAHASLYQPQDSEIAILDELEYVKSWGSGLYVGSVGQIEKLRNTELRLYHYDKQLWEELTVPAYTDIHGEYPIGEDEIMAPLWVLDKLGIENPEIGMNLFFPINLDSSGVFKDKTFTLSGWFTGYAHLRSGGADIIFVSEAMAKSSGHTFKNHGITYIRFTDNNAEKHAEQLVSDLGLADVRNVSTVPIYIQDDSSGMAMAAGVCIIIAFLMLTGYLLIYNVLYISIAKDIRFYGLLKAIGMTSRQISGSVYGQITRLCLIGIPVGLILSFAVSFLLIPALLTSFLTAGDIATGVSVSFHPIIYIGAALFALLTAYIGAARPARYAARISPVEAVRYAGVSVRGTRKRGSVFGSPARMALRNVLRRRKQAVLAFLSLFFGLTTFMIVTTVVKSMNTDNFIKTYMDSDVVLTNERARMITQDDRQRITPNIMGVIHKMPGLKSTRLYYSECGSIKYSTEQFGKYFEAMFGSKDMSMMFGTDEVTDDMISQNFITYIYSLNRADIKKLNKERGVQIDIDAFERGEFALTDTDSPELFDTVDEFELTFTRDGKTLEIPLGGFLPNYYSGMGGGLAPSVYVSDKVLERLFNDPVIMKVELDINEDDQQNAVAVLEALIKNNYDVSLQSKVGVREMLKNAKFMMLILGDGIAAVLGLIGILNFVSITSTGIFARKRELAVLESLGQSKQQIKRMLTAEGAIYAAFSILLSAVFGSTVTYGVFRLFSSQADYAVFSFPYISLAVIIFIMTVVCLAVPIITYRSISRATIIERLREAE
ncbi:MAG: FtsX-like permease family protein [Eubacteriales bacterium]